MRNSFRPHVWGSFFHNTSQLDIITLCDMFSSPCLGILFSPLSNSVSLYKEVVFSSPCLGILFSQGNKRLIELGFSESFRPHVWGSFFHKKFVPLDTPIDINMFSSPCMGILFSPHLEIFMKVLQIRCFRPHVWGFFFHNLFKFALYLDYVDKFSSPCMGILFSPEWQERIEAVKDSFRPHVWGFFFHKKLNADKAAEMKEFSSPCMGILFSQLVETW